VSRGSPGASFDAPQHWRVSPLHRFVFKLNQSRKNSSVKKQIQPFGLVLLSAAFTLFSTLPVRAASHTWIGQGITKNWSLPANWVGDSPPAVGEAHITLTFPTVIAAYRNSTNNLSGLAVDEIILSGSGNNLYGNTVHLTGAGAEQILCGGNNAIFAPLVLDTGYNVFDVNASDTLHLSGLISGSGGFTKIGLGYLRMEPATDNTFAGETKVLDGEMDLDGPAVSISGPFTIGQLGSAAFPLVFVEAANQNGDNATVKVVENGFLRLNGFSDTVGALVFQAGGIDTSNPANTITGVLSLNGDVSALAHQYAGFVRGKLSLNGADRTFDVAAGAVLSMQCAISSGVGTAGVIKTGVGRLTLSSANTFNGFTKVNAGTLGAYNSAALGTIANGTMVAAGATLELQDAIVGNESLLLNGTGVGGTNGALVLYGTNSWSGIVQLAGDTIINAMNFPGYSSASTFSGVINGGGKLIKTGDGTLTLSGPNANTYSGGTWVQGGAMVLGKTSFITAVPGPLYIGVPNPAAVSNYISPTNILRLASSHQIADATVIQIDVSGMLDLNGYNELIGGLSMTGGVVQTGTGLLTLNGNVLATSIWNNNPTINGLMSLGGATRTFTIPYWSALFINANLNDGFGTGGVVKMDKGVMWLSGTNSYSGLTTVSNGDLVLPQPSGLGSAAAGTVVCDGAILEVGLAFHGPVETLTLNDGGMLASVGNNSWDGNIVLNGNASIIVDPMNLTETFDINGAISGTGNLTFIYGNILRLGGSAPNTFNGSMIVLGSTSWASTSTLELHKPAGITAIPGPLIIGSATNPPNHEVVRLFAPNQIADNAPVVVNASGLLDLNNQYDAIGSLAGSGNVNLLFGALTAGGDNSDTTFSGAIAGVGFVPLTKEGTGRMTLCGTNTCSGKMVVNNGHLYVNGAQSCGVELSPNGSLHGKGVVGAITGVGGWTIPGDNLTAPTHGKMNSASLTLDAASDFNIDLGGTAASGNFDQLLVAGGVVLSNANFHLTQSASGQSNDVFTIIKNGGGSAVKGTFAGFPEGTVFTLSPTQKFKISYQGGAYSNDVVVIQVSAPAPSQITAITRLGNGQIQLTGTGLAGLLYTIQANTNLSTTNWLNIGSTNADQNGVINFADVDAPSYPQRFYRFAAP
jgi:fibronectin-binding autotransporter adhesin